LCIAGPVEICDIDKIYRLSVVWVRLAACTPGSRREYGVLGKPLGAGFVPLSGVLLHEDIQGFVCRLGWTGPWTHFPGK